MANKDSNASASEAGPPLSADNVIDLLPYLRGLYRADDEFLNAAPQGVEECLAATPSDIDHEVQSMFLDAVDLPIPERLAALVNQLGLDADPDQDPSDLGDHV